MNKERFMKDFNGEKVFCLEYDKETLVDMVLELQSRIDKAIEYIDNHQLVFELSTMEQIKSWYDKLYKTLSNILEGDDEDE